METVHNQFGSVRKRTIIAQNAKSIQHLIRQSERNFLKDSSFSLKYIPQESATKLPFQTDNQNRHVNMFLFRSTRCYHYDDLQVQ